jgi:hypothetical protein
MPVSLAALRAHFKIVISGLDSRSFTHSVCYFFFVALLLG